MLLGNEAGQEVFGVENSLFPKHWKVTREGFGSELGQI